MSSRPTAIVVRTWDEKQFAGSAREWNTLLQQSTADPLFMSWEWQWHWWLHHAALVQGDLVLLAAYRTDGQLVGIAPLYRHRVRYRAGLRGVRLELIGLAFRDTRPVYSEYLDFILEPTHAEATISAFARTLYADRQWGDFIVANTRSDSAAARLVHGLLSADCYVRQTDELHAHHVHLNMKFEDYVYSLGSGARRKIWHHRRRLQSPRLDFASIGDVSRFLDRLDEFHRVRWGRSDESGRRRRFHMEFCVAMARQNALRMSILSSAGDPVSVMYNLSLGKTEYNLQSGFNPSYSPVSPGYLHFGYCIEDACGRGMHEFDFLGGGGRHRQYKQDFQPSIVELVTLQVIRSPLLRLLYQAHDTL